MKLLLNPFSSKLNNAEAREVAKEFEVYLSKIDFTLWSCQNFLLNEYSNFLCVQILSILASPEWDSYINVHVDTSDNIMVEELVEPTNGRCMWSTLSVFYEFF